CRRPLSPTRRPRNIPEECPGAKSIRKTPRCNVSRSGTARSARRLGRVGCRRCGGVRTQMEKPVQIELCDRLVADPSLRPHLVAVFSIGSTSTDFDVHVDSDVDLQVVMDEPELDAVIALGRILRGYRNLDLSVIYLADIVDSAGSV